MKILMKLSSLAIGIIFFVACGGVQGDKAKTTAAETAKEAPLATETYALAGNSQVEWVGSKKFIGDKHKGFLPIKGGTFDVAEGEIVGGNFTLDMTKISNTDLDGEWKKKLEVHLKGTDFFDVAKFPIANFTITNVEKLSGVAGATHQVKGNLTIKNITKSIEFNAAVSTEGDAIIATVPQFVIDRTQWGIEYNSSDEKSVADDMKDKIISNDIGIKLSLKGRRVI